jgi:hypothetical protein
MTMGAPAIDYQGSGALEYLRAEVLNRQEIHTVLTNWSQYVPHANSIFEYSFTITQPFEARRNLQNVLETVRSRIGQLSAIDIAVAQQALDRLRARGGENVDSWAQSLATDLSRHRD